MEIGEIRMFTEKQEVRLEILDDGKINVVIIKHYLKDGQEIGQDNWGCCLEPHPAYLAYAEEILDEYYMNIIRTAWSEDVMSAYARKMNL